MNIEKYINVKYIISDYGDLKKKTPYGIYSLNCPYFISNDESKGSECGIHCALFEIIFGLKAPHDIRAIQHCCDRQIPISIEENKKEQN